MHKKQKRERPVITISLTKVQEVDSNADVYQGNSSNIILQNEQSNNNQQKLTEPVTVEPRTQIIKVQSARIVDFEEEQPQQQNRYQNKKQNTQVQKQQSKINKDSQQQYRYRKEKQQGQQYMQMQYKKQSKQTVPTYSSNSNLKSKYVRQMVLQQKVQAQHYDYDGSGKQNDSQEQQNQEQEQKQQQEQQDYKEQRIKKLITVHKTFIASNFDDLIFSKIPPKCKITCAVNFNHQFLSLKRTYDLYLVNEKKYLLTAQRSRFKLTSQFTFFNKKTKNKQAVGELKSNFTGLEYVINKIYKHQDNRISQQCWVGYNFNILGLSDQRNITLLKNLNAKLEKIPHFSQIKNYYQNGITSKFQKFINRKAVQNKNGNYELDFHGKVNNPSATNFILTDLKDEQCILFGKRNKNTYILQVGYPFSIFQGFAVAISSLDHKLCVR